MTTPANPNSPRRMRGARPTPRHKLCGAKPHTIRSPRPVQFAWLPTLLSMWLNDTYGDCVSAEEAFAKACFTPEIFMRDDTVFNFAHEHDFLDGSDLLSVIQAMQNDGMIQDGEQYLDGEPLSVDWTDQAALENAISQGPVKIGVAADQLESCVDQYNGWFATKFLPTDPSDEDHCVSLCGYGMLSYLFSMLGLVVPDGVDSTQPGYLLFTWGTIGVIDVPSMLAITHEAWLRTPTTIVV